MTPIILDRRALCAVFSMFAILIAFLYARGTAVFVGVGLGIAGGVVVATVLSVSLVGLAWLFSSDTFKRVAASVREFMRRNWSFVVWSGRVVGVAFTTACWYAATTPDNLLGRPIISASEAAVFFAASALASICATRAFLSIIPEADRKILNQFAHVSIWFVTSSVWLLILTLSLSVD